MYSTGLVHIAVQIRGFMSYSLQCICAHGGLFKISPVHPRRNEGPSPSPAADEVDHDASAGHTILAWTGV